MNLLKNDVDTFNKIVFEKRNKNYGAYAIRAAYNGTAIKSTLITGGSFLLLVLLLSAFSGGKVVKENTIVEPDVNIAILRIDEIDQTPKEEPKPKTASSPASMGSNLVKISNTAPDQNTMKPNDKLDNSFTGLSNDPEANGNSMDTTKKAGPDVNAIVVREPEPIKPKEIRQWAEVMPKFDGDLGRFIQRNINYPEVAISNEAEGTVYLQFVINETGAISNVKVMKGIGFGCDEEAVRVVEKMPNWSPGKMGDENVKVLFNLPIRFKLSK